MLGDLRRGRGIAGCGRSGLVEPLDAHGELLKLARDAHRPAVVAVVAFERAGDARHRVGAERHVARGIEALDGPDQRQARDLLEVLERLRAAPVPARQAARERQEMVDHGVAVAAAAGASIFEDQLLLGLPSREHGSLPWEVWKRIRSGPGERTERVQQREPARRPSGRLGGSISLASPRKRPCVRLPVGGSAGRCLIPARSRSRCPAGQAPPSRCSRSACVVTADRCCSEDQRETVRSQWAILKRPSRELLPAGIASAATSTS